MINSSNRKIVPTDGDIELSSHSSIVNPTNRLFQIIIHFAVDRERSYSRICRRHNLRSDRMSLILVSSIFVILLRKVEHTV